MISIVDAREFQYVLRPTVYQPFGALGEGPADTPRARSVSVADLRPGARRNEAIETFAEPAIR